MKVRVTKNIIHKTSGLFGVQGLKVKHIIIDTVVLMTAGFFLFLLSDFISFNLLMWLLFIVISCVFFGTIMAISDISILNNFLKPSDKRYYVKTEVIRNGRNKETKNKNAKKHTKHDTL